VRREMVRGRAQRQRPGHDPGVAEEDLEVMQLAPAGPSAASRRRKPAAPVAWAVSSTPDGEDEVFGIAEVAAAFGISTRTIRFYEQKGLISLRRINRARVLTRRDRARLGLILRGRAIGSSIEEIRHFLDLYGRHGEGRTRQLRYAIEHTSALIADLEGRRAKLDAVLEDLRAMNQTCRRNLAAMKPRTA